MMVVVTSITPSDARGQRHGDAATATTVVIHFLYIYLHASKKNSSPKLKVNDDHDDPHLQRSRNDAPPPPASVTRQ